ncbi:hypothetical protein PROFUN_03320 [Planoprotostelium fungivorum]|uniref:Uncharacterized protein n=1 Tax=Planoprotostelium fungivorum TaxID=1890364 RepID=A0A2P6NWV1_9EUKA|nr:hypothetical protein PROFUN_03320 [Planoprotostelium fungivorum]
MQGSPQRNNIFKPTRHSRAHHKTGKMVTPNRIKPDHSMDNTLQAGLLHYRSELLRQLCQDSQKLHMQREASVQTMTGVIHRLVGARAREEQRKGLESGFVTQVCSSQ